MLKIDFTKKQLSNAINQHQRNLDYNNSQRHRFTRNDLFVDKTEKKVRNSTQHKAIINKSLADIQKEQIELRRIDAANDLIKSRIQDEENLLNIQQRFPYGKENVGISEDVLERYKGNFLEQSRMLEKFRIQAETLKKTSRVRNVRKNTNIKPIQRKQIENWGLRSYPDPQKELQQQRMREALQRKRRQQEQERRLREQRELEKKNMKKIADSLSGLSLQLHNNSYILEKGIRQLQNRFKKPQKDRDFGQRQAYQDILDLQSSSQKIPVIMYQKQPYDARLYFSDVFKNTEKIEKSHSSNTHQQEYNQIVRILNENSRRLAYLDKISEKSPLYDN